MKNYTHVLKGLVVSMAVTLTLTACGTETLPSASVLLGQSSLSAQEADTVDSALKDVFGLLTIEGEAVDAEQSSDETETGSVARKSKAHHSLRARFESLKTTHPELYAQVVDIIGLPSPSDRQERLGQLKNERPEMMKRKGSISGRDFGKTQGPRSARGPRSAHGQANKFGKGQWGRSKSQGPGSFDKNRPGADSGNRPSGKFGRGEWTSRFSKNPDKYSSRNERPQMDREAMKAKFEEFKRLSPEERKAKFEAMKQSSASSQ